MLQFLLSRPNKSGISGQITIRYASDQVVNEMMGELLASETSLSSNYCQLISIYIMLVSFLINQLDLSWHMVLCWNYDTTVMSLFWLILYKSWHLWNFSVIMTQNNIVMALKCNRFKLHSTLGNFLLGSKRSGTIAQLNFLKFQRLFPQLSKNNITDNSTNK